jgi:hypothetical protein
MKFAASVSLSTAIVSLALLYPGICQAREDEKSPASSEALQAAAQHEATLMVPAQATLVKQLDAKKIQVGNQFQVRLTQTVHLKNGPDLPRGTILVGVVATGNEKAGDASRITLRFTGAELKGGKVVPITATIVGISPPVTDSYASAGTTGADTWNGSLLHVDQIDALPGVDLHSQIASTNSGELVSPKKDGVKLSIGSKFTLAIAPQENGNGGNGGAA